MHGWLHPADYIKRLDQALWDRAHPFSSFENHHGLPMPPPQISDPNWAGHVFALSPTGALVKRCGTGDQTQGRSLDKMPTVSEERGSNGGGFVVDNPLMPSVHAGVRWGKAGRRGTQLEVEPAWDVGVVIRVYQGPQATTRKLMEAEQDPEIHCWGGFKENGLLYYVQRGSRPVTMIAGGSGMAYLLDAASQASPDMLPIRLVMTTADLGLFQYFCFAMEQIATMRGGPDAMSNVRVLAVLTDPNVESINERTLTLGAVQLGRMDFDVLLEATPVGHVFVIGSAGLQRVVKPACEKYGHHFHAGAAYESAPVVPAPSSSAAAAAAADLNGGEATGGGRKKRAARLSTSVMEADTKFKKQQIAGGQRASAFDGFRKRWSRTPEMNTKRQGW